MASDKIKVSFKLEDLPMIIETMEQLQEELDKYKHIVKEIKKFISLELSKTRKPNQYDMGIYDGNLYIFKKIEDLESEE